MTRSKGPAEEVSLPPTRMRKDVSTMNKGKDKAQGQVQANMTGMVWCHPVLHQVLSVHPQQRRARWGYPQPPSKLLVNPIQSQIKLRTLTTRQAHLTQLKCSRPSQIGPLGNELGAKQTVRGT